MALRRSTSYWAGVRRSRHSSSLSSTSGTAPWDVTDLGLVGHPAMTACSVPSTLARAGPRSAVRPGPIGCGPGEGRPAGRRHRLPAAPADPDHQQAPPARLRPPDDRLGHRGPGQGRDPRVSCSSPGGEHMGDFLRLLGDGHDFGLEHLAYASRSEPGGIAEALGLAESLRRRRADRRDAGRQPLRALDRGRWSTRSQRPAAAPGCCSARSTSADHLRHLGVAELDGGGQHPADRREARANRRASSP